MSVFSEELQGHIEKLQEIADKMEHGQADMSEIKSYLPSMNQLITMIIELSAGPVPKIELNNEFLIQVLNDVVYGIENEDPVFLQDVLQYGLLEIYSYVNEELRDREIYE